MVDNRLRSMGMAAAIMVVSVLPLESASATTASGSATLDWSGLMLSFGAGSVSPLNVTSSVTLISAPALSTFDSQSSFDATNPLESSTHVSFPGLFDFDLVSSASESSLDASFSLVSPLPGSAFNNTASTAVTTRTATITTSSAGTLTISVPYTLLSTTDEAGVFSDSSVTASLVRRRGVGSAFTELAAAYASADFAGDATSADSGLLTLVVPFLSGDKISLEFQAVVTGYANVPAPVPLPPSALLFSGGLLALLVRRRRA